MDIQKANRTGFNCRSSIQLTGFATLSGQSLLYRKFEEFILKWHVKLFLFYYLIKALLAHVYTGGFHWSCSGLDYLRHKNCKIISGEGIGREWRARCRNFAASCGSLSLGSATTSCNQD